jgi:hypothetical protein
MRADSIWIAFGSLEDDTPATRSPFSRSEAIYLVSEVLHRRLSDGHRTLLCFDFAYGFPRDFAATLQTATGWRRRYLPWLAVWQYLRNEIGMTSNRRPTNCASASNVDPRRTSSPQSNKWFFGRKWSHDWTPIQSWKNERFPRRPNYLNSIWDGVKVGRRFTRLPRGCKRAQACEPPQLPRLSGRGLRAFRL